jgi:hypothetical protein
MTPFFEQESTRKRLIDSYIRQYEQNDLTQTARSAGWGVSLLQYVREAASVQAQMLIPTNGVGYNSAVLFSHIDHNGREEVIKAFLEDCRRQILNTGSICVSPPPEAIEVWIAETLRHSVKSGAPATPAAGEVGIVPRAQNSATEHPAIGESTQSADIKTEITIDDVM